MERAFVPLKTATLLLMPHATVLLAPFRGASLGVSQFGACCQGAALSLKDSRPLPQQDDEVQKGKSTGRTGSIWIGLYRHQGVRA